MKLINLFLFILLISIKCSLADINKEFKNWKLNFKKIALENNISEKTFDTVMSDTKFLSDVIKYDRYQPEFYEDTKTYISKRTSSKKVSLGKKFYEKNSMLINTVENEFNIERELLLAFYLIASKGYSDFQLSDPSMMLFIYLAGPMTVIPLFLYVRGVELCGLGPTGMIFYITPTFQFLLGYFYYNEPFSITKLVSFIFIWIAVIIYLKDLHETN